MFFKFENRIYEARMNFCNQAVNITDVSGLKPKFITEVPFDFTNPGEWQEVAQAALTTHNAIERARNAKPVEQREAVAA